jgi:hypothetical protein
MGSDFCLLCLVYCHLQYVHVFSAEDRHQYVVNVSCITVHSDDWSNKA